MFEIVTISGISAFTALFVSFLTQNLSAGVLFSGAIAISGVSLILSWLLFKKMNLKKQQILALGK